jgi:hypothetical protein
MAVEQSKLKNRIHWKLELVLRARLLSPILRMRYACQRANVHPAYSNSGGCMLRTLCLVLATITALLTGADSRAQPLTVIGHDPRFGSICAGPLGPGPCADVARFLAMQQRFPSPDVILPPPLLVPGLPPLQQIGFAPGIGPICAGPLGPGPCAAVQQYLMSMSANAPRLPVVIRR